MKTGIELIAQERKGITELRLCLEQGIQQCRDADDMDSCSFGYEKGVLITGNDAVYLLTLINQSLNKEQPQKLSPSEQKKNDPWYPSEGETDWIGVGAKQNQPQEENGLTQSEYDRRTEVLKKVISDALTEIEKNKEARKQNGNR